MSFYGRSPRFCPEIWLRIASFSLDDLPSLALVCTATRAAATEYRFRSLRFKNPITFLTTVLWWHQLDNDVFLLVKELSLGTVAATDCDKTNTHSHQRFNSSGAFDYFCMHLQSFLSLRCLSLYGLSISPDIALVLKTTTNLQHLEMCRVCVADGTHWTNVCCNSIVTLHLEAVCWHGVGLDLELLRACKNTKTLVLTWHEESHLMSSPDDDEYNSNVVSLKLLTVIASWSFDDPIQADRRRFFTFLSKFVCLNVFEIEGALPSFPTHVRYTSITHIPLTTYIGPVELVPHLSQLTTLTALVLPIYHLSSEYLLDIRLMPSIVDFSVELHPSKLNNVKRIVNLLPNLLNLSVCFVDEYIDIDVMLISVESIINLHFNLSNITITSDSDCYDEPPFDRFRALKRRCPSLAVIILGERLWRFKRGIWRQSMFVESSYTPYSHDSTR